MLEHEELSAIVKGLPIGVVAVDRNLRVLYHNTAAATAAAFGPRVVTAGRPLPHVDGDVNVTEWVEALFTRPTGPLELQVERDGRTYSLKGMRPHGRRFAAIFIADVSDRSRRDRSRTEFVANAAHELLTPLTGIASAAHVLESGAKEVPETRDRFLEHIGRECNRLIRISRGLLVLARSQSGEEPPRPDFVNVRSLLADVLDASPNGVAVDLRCPEDMAVFADRDLVEIALSNLVANAIRHTDGGTVSIAAENSSDRTVGIEIADSGGRGRSRDDLERLRRRFATGGGRDGGGFGLGISIASQALGAVGGTLDYSTENGSHRVRIELPAGHG